MSDNLTEVTAKPNPDVIQILEDLLEKAKTGELQGIIDVVMWDDGTSAPGWAGIKRRDMPRALGELLMSITEYTTEANGIHSSDIIYD